MWWPARCLHRSIIPLTWQPTCHPTPTPRAAPRLAPVCAQLRKSSQLLGHFLTGFSVASQEQLRHLISPDRLAFCSAPLPDLRAMVRMPKATSCQELQTCLQRTLPRDALSMLVLRALATQEPLMVVNMDSALQARCGKQLGWGTPACGHPFLGACAPDAAPRARLPLSFPAASAMSMDCCHEEQLPCRAAVWLLAPTSKCGCPALLSPAYHMSSYRAQTQQPGTR